MKRAFGVALLAGCSTFHQVHAQSTNCSAVVKPADAETVLVQIDHPAFFECLATDKDPGARELLDQSPSVGASPAEGAALIARYRELIKPYVSAMSNSDTARSTLILLDKRFDIVLGTLLSGNRRIDDLTQQAYWPASPDEGLYLPPPRNPADVPQLYLRALIDSGCQRSDDIPLDTNRCAASIEATVASLRAIKLTHLALGKVDREKTEAFRKRLLLERAKWNSYYADAIVEFPWESYLNIWIKDSLLPDCPHNADTAPPKPGEKCDSDLIDARPWQVLFLHPAAIFEYVGGAPDDEGLKVGVLLEAIGFNRFQFDSLGKVKGGFGASAGVLYAERHGLRQTRGALTLHVHNKYSAGLSVGNDEVGIYLNLPLTEKLRGTYEGYREWIDKVK